MVKIAERRMFSKSIIDSDAFLDMPITSQLLYFQLAMRADDDGFVNKPKAIMRLCGCKDDDVKILFAKKFLIPFESGVVVIKHWKIHNYIAKDRYTETKYKEEKDLLELDENNAYTLPVDNPYTERIQVVDKMETQVRLGKDSIDNNILSAPNGAQCAQDDVHEVCTKDVNAHFEQIWLLYPNKKGKGRVSDKQKKKLYEISYEEMERVINRYNTELAKDEWRQPQNGSTFFNSGYIDYLDGNYVPSNQKPRNQKITISNQPDILDGLFPEV